MAEIEEDIYRPPVINNVLCYASTARHSMRSDDVMRVCLSFYKDDEIIKSKDQLCDLIGEKSKRRRHENRMLNEMKDIMDMLTRCDDTDVKLPKFVVDSYDGLPPSSGFELVASYMLNLIDEISNLKKEVQLLTEARLIENNFHHDTTIIKEDLLSIKGEIRKLKHKLINEDTEETILCWIASINQ